MSSFADQPHRTAGILQLNRGKLLAKPKISVHLLLGMSPLVNLHADDHPTLDALRHFPVKDRFIDIAKKIATDYKLFGTQLLKDSDGNEVRIIEMKHGDPVDITVEILKQWLQGKGRKPVTWQTLVKCLQDTNLNVLADDMESSLSVHDGSKNSDKAPSGEL